MKALLIAKLVKWEERDMLTVKEEAALAEEEAVAESVATTVAVAVAVAVVEDDEEEDNKSTCSTLNDWHATV